MEFSELNLHPNLERGLREAGYLTCMPVQEQVLQSAFSGRDLYVQSQTGTGKTAAFLVVIFQRLLTEAMLSGKKAIIMVPTRELAVQVETEAKLLGKYLPFKIGSFYGGVGYTHQTKLLRDNVQIIVGTPGRVLDLNSGGQMNLMDIAFLVLDEADRMFDMGFYPDLRKLIKAVPPVDKRQTLLFSATLNTWVKNLAWEYTKNPYEIAIEPETVTVEEVDQLLYHVSSADKMKLLLGIFKREKPESAVIFCNTKRYAEIVAKRLKINGYECEYIIGDLPQTTRLKVIESIKGGKLKFLVATDVAARGLDIEGLALVVNYDLPNESENYVHRIGRTARAGKTGRAISFASEQDVYGLSGIERYIGRKISSENAIPELFDEDKSEGKRIHTEFREGAGERRSAHKEGRRDHDRKDYRGKKEKHGQKERYGHKDHEKGKHADTRERAKTRGASETAVRDQGVRLSELTLEERMAYYKRKYDKGSLPKVSSPESKTESGEKKRNRRRRRKPFAEKAQEAVNESAAVTSGKQSAAPAKQSTAADKRSTSNGKRSATAGKQSAAAGKHSAAADRRSVATGKQSAALAVQQEPKKSVLSKIFGIFRKDKVDKPTT